MSGYIVARSFPGADRWEILASYAAKPAAVTMRQHRASERGYRVKLFTDRQWDALPYGERSDDWISFGNDEVWREPDGKRWHDE